MTLHTGQLCSTRTVFRVIIATILLLAVVLIYRSFIIPQNGICNSSSDCYNLIKEKAAQKFRAYPALLPPSLDQQRQQLQEQDEAFKAMYQDDSKEKAMGIVMENVQKVAAANGDEIVITAEERVTSEEEEEYKRLTDATLPRVKGAFVVLARNSELYALRSSMRYLEDRFNHKYSYPWIFLNEQPFTEEFKNMTQMMTKAEVHYGLVPQEHWSYPDYIDQEYAAQCRQDLSDQGIVYGGSESYRHMCRYQSGFFMLHPLLDDLDYYW
jgi:hypothetical protein